jgi:biotin carboxylase
MTARRHVLVLTNFQIAELFDALSSRGVGVVLLTIPETFARMTLPACVVRAETIDVTDQRAVARQILRLNETYAFEAIVPVMEFGLLPAALAASELKLPTPSVRAVQNTRDKLRMRRVLDAAGLGQVRYRHCQTLAEAESFWRLVGGPVFLKPAAGSGSDGVSRIADARDLQTAWELAAGAPGFTGALCEEFVVGPEVSLEGYSIDGRFVPIALTDKLTDEHFLERGHSQPARRTPEEYRSVCDFAARALAALGVRTAVSHTELKLTAGGPVMIETHTRMGGGNIHQLTRTTTGVDLADLMVALALGEEPVVTPRETGIAAAIRFMAGRAGVVASVTVPRLHEGGDVTAAVAYVQPGDVTTGRSSSLSRLGHAMAVGATPEAAADAAERCLAEIRVEFAGESFDQCLSSSGGRHAGSAVAIGA